MISRWCVVLWSEIGKFLKVFENSEVIISTVLFIIKLQF